MGPSGRGTAFPSIRGLKRPSSKILGKVGNKGHSTVTIIRVDRPRRKLLRGRRLEAQCTAFDFHVGGLEKAGAREIVASLNTRSAGPSDTETSRSPELSLQVYKEHKRVYFRMELPNFGRR